ncbi:SRPBCC family protein [Pontibacter sp. G13]|uniref:SRPBCC family protein n=1 Tax=Pontibacter sp. G13 TaxID=3074898 RepID=UPI00288A6AB1|nr:SRPBCC family protein [Pontibacter sp. G13]WNJ19912.1 SRPBCC family protein [Pontibacter sp. G13]
MKRIFIPLFLLLTTHSIMMAQTEKKYKVLQITRTSETINVPANSLWEVVREFDNVALWSSNVDQAIGSGEPEFEGATCSERSCDVNNIAGYSRVVEKLVLFSDELQELAYQLTEGAPGFVVFAQNHWKVKQVGPQQSAIHMEVTLHLKRLQGFCFGGHMRRTIEKNIGTAMTELKAYAEAGKISDKKRERTF